MALGVGKEAVEVIPGEKERKRERECVCAGIQTDAESVW